MDDYERRRRQRNFVLGSLLVLGASGRRGRRALRWLKRLCGWGFILCLLAIPLNLYGIHLYGSTFGRKMATETGQAVLGFLALSFGVSLLSGIMWCYLAAAKWLTDDDEADSEEEDDDD